LLQTAKTANVPFPRPGCCNVLNVDNGAARETLCAVSTFENFRGTLANDDAWCHCIPDCDARLDRAVGDPFKTVCMLCGVLLIGWLMYLSLALIF
jgi:hypothetical protein